MPASAHMRSTSCGGIRGWWSRPTRGATMPIAPRSRVTARGTPPFRAGVYGSSVSPIARSAPTLRRSRERFVRCSGLWFDGPIERVENELLTRVGPGTAMGELMRSYWLPVMESSELGPPDGPPQRIRLLGEDLVAFRDTDGRVGLMA